MRPHLADSRRSNVRGGHVMRPVRGMLRLAQAPVRSALFNSAKLRYLSRYWRSVT